MTLFVSVHYFHIDHNAPCLLPQNSSRRLYFTWRYWKQWLSSIFFWAGGGGGGGVNRVYCGLFENGEFKRDKLQIDILFKVARPSIFVGTPSIFQSLILKKFDLCCKKITTDLLHIDLTLLLYYWNKYHVIKT